MTITQISAWIMLVSCGLWAGGILIFAVERTNLWRRMPIDQYAVDFRRSLFRVDPMMPVLGVIAGAAATIFALQPGGAASGLAWAGLGFIVLVVVASITIAEPINSKFRRLPEGQAPQRAEHYRTVWRRFHAVRIITESVIGAGRHSNIRRCRRSVPNYWCHDHDRACGNPPPPAGYREAI